MTARNKLRRGWPTASERHMKTKSEPRSLDVNLTPAEKAVRAQRLVELLGEVDDIERQLATQKQTAKAAMDDRKDTIKQLTSELRTGKSVRVVECQWSIDLAAGSKHLIRMDSGEVVDIRPLDANDRQMQLDAVNYRPGDIDDAAH